MINTAHLHPMIVHFPVALILVGFLADVMSLFFKKEKCLSRAGLYLMVLGAIAAVAAWGSGHLFTAHPEEGAIGQVFENHETGALITMIIMIIGAALRVFLVIKKKEETQLKWLVFAIYFMGFAAVIFTAFMGGKMVYDFMLSL
jgi:uncharacterized membrane protein